MPLFQWLALDITGWGVRKRRLLAWNCLLISYHILSTLARSHTNYAVSVELFLRRGEIFAMVMPPLSCPPSWFLYPPPPSKYWARLTQWNVGALQILCTCVYIGHRVALVHFVKMSLNPLLSFAVMFGEMKLKFLFVFDEFLYLHFGAQLLHAIDHDNKPRKKEKTCLETTLNWIVRDTCTCCFFLSFLAITTHCWLCLHCWSTLL